MKTNYTIKKDLQNNLNQSYDKFIVSIESRDDYRAYEHLIERVFDATWNTDFDTQSIEFPFFISFSLIPDCLNSALIIQPCDLKEYLEDEEYLVHPTILSLKDEIELENFLKCIREESLKLATDIDLWGLDNK